MSNRNVSMCLLFKSQPGAQNISYVICRTITLTCVKTKTGQGLENETRKLLMYLTKPIGSLLSS